MNAVFFTTWVPFMIAARAFLSRRSFCDLSQYYGGGSRSDASARAQAQSQVSILTPEWLCTNCWTSHQMWMLMSWMATEINIFHLPVNTQLLDLYICVHICMCAVVPIMMQCWEEAKLDCSHFVLSVIKQARLAWLLPFPTCHTKHYDSSENLQYHISL